MDYSKKVEQALLTYVNNLFIPIVSAWKINEKAYACTICWSLWFSIEKPLKRLSFRWSRSHMHDLCMKQTRVRASHWKDTCTFYAFFSGTLFSVMQTAETARKTVLKRMPYALFSVKDGKRRKKVQDAGTNRLQFCTNPVWCAGAKL